MCTVAAFTPSGVTTRLPRITSTVFIWKLA
jgi:hypothetical protein